jgi:hypothetical protein
VCRNLGDKFMAIKEIFYDKDAINLIVGIFLGATLGFAGNFFTEKIKRFWERKDKKEDMAKIFLVLEKEISEGIKRCDGLTGFKNNNKISFSRIYVTLWDSVRFEICINFEDQKLLESLHQIYYRFDLINFNMEKDRFDVGAAFAEEYIDEIKRNFAIFQNRAGLYKKAL